MYVPPHRSGQGQGYASPPLPPSDAYRSSPIPVVPRQAYQSFSPVSPVPTNGYSPMSRYQQFTSPPPPPQGQYQRQSKYPGPSPSDYAGQQQQYPQQPRQQQQQRYKGTLAPGTFVQVGENVVRVEKYLSEGGYAHVYLTRSDKPIYPPVRGERKGRGGDKGFTEHCLKRIAFEDDSVWTDVKKEIEVMKALPPNPHLVQYLGSTHNRTTKGGHEVFILMEFCSGGGIIDLLNKRLRDRLKEVEILNIFTDVCEAVAAMHALKTPLLHRDLKIENVLSGPGNSPPTSTRPMGLIFKLCDFGSTTFPASHPPSSKIEADAQVMDLNKHTTLQYRSPEMVEPMLGLAVGLPSDVWALGVLLYKLCYYTTPFEEHGTLAIVNAKYTFPQYPVYSPRIQHLIASMLMEQPIRRPTVFDILRVSHEMSGTRPEVDYPASFSKQIAPPSKPTASAQSHKPSSSSSNLLDFSSPSLPQPPSAAPSSPDAASIQPQRRGRPTREGSSNRLPPMPQPPAMPTQPQPQTQGQAQSQAQAPRQRMQVTGERAPIKSPSPAGTLDAFGMPTHPKPTTQGSASSGFTDSFTSTTKPFRPTSRFGRGLSQTQSGFGDSFDASASANAPPAKTASRIEHVNPGSLEIRQTASPITTGSGSRPEPGGDNFESRYPSIETLDSGETTTPTPNLISPIMSPPAMASRPSMLGSMTGGDVRQPLNSHLVAGGPQPRSTNVTGTAFKEQQSRFTKSPSPIATKDERPPVQNLMSGEAEDVAARAPLIHRASSTFNGGGASEEKNGGPSERPALEVVDMVDSSDEEDQGPESATSTRKQYAQVDEPDGPSAPLAQEPSPEQPKSATLPPRDDAPSRQTSAPRPQTMYGYPSRSPTKTELGLPKPTESRPAHTRKGSINDIVTRFEGMKPSAPSVAAKPQQYKKPTLDTIRAEGLQAPILPASATARHPLPPKPSKPQGLASNSRPEGLASSNSYSSIKSGRPVPLVKPKPIRANTKDTPAPVAVAAAVSPPPASDRSSPEKQQSVNALVARWNQGQISAKPPIKPKPVLQ